MSKKEKHIPRLGMNRRQHPSEESNKQYSFALNANTDSINEGDSSILQNESSNTLCSRFLDGYVVIGKKFDLVRKKTYYFLTNPLTGCSEIGYIDVPQEAEEEESVKKNCGCSPKAVFDEGLEKIEHWEESCVYNTIISDCCERDSGQKGAGCLNFSKEYPIKNPVIRHSTLGDEIYFTDYLNEQRYIRLDYIEEYKKDVDPCNGEEVDYCLDCDKLRIFPLYDRPCIEPKVIQNGGQLQAGVYEVFFFWCNDQGEIISNLIGSTNPISIWDKNKGLLNQTDLDYATSYAFSVNINIEDKKFDYYKVVVAYSSQNNPAPVFYDYGKKSVYDSEVVISYTGSAMGDASRDSDFSSEELFAQRPIYDRAKGIENINGYLFQYGLKKKRQPNLQPIVNLMGSFVEWTTGVSTEDLYKDGVSDSKYRGFMRDETYPLGIVFESEGGQRSILFPLISRPPTEYDLEDITKDNINTSSITDKVVSCGDNKRTKRWQFENTASLLPPNDCTSGETITVPYTYDFKCESEESVGIDGEVKGDMYSFLPWINEHAEDIKSATPGSEYYYPNIKAQLIATYNYPTPCCEQVPEGCPNCSNFPATPDEEYVQAVSVGETVITEEQNTSFDCGDIEEDDRAGVPDICNMFLPDPENSGKNMVDNDLPGTIYKKMSTGKTDCSSALPVPTIESYKSMSLGYSLNNISSDDASDLQSNLTTNCSGSGFANKINKNAIWFKIDNPENITFLELSKFSCNSDNLDDASNSNIRVSLWNGCGDTTAIDCKIIDLKNNSCNDKMIKLDPSSGSYPYTGGSIYISIDTPIILIDTKYVTTAPCSCFGITYREIPPLSKVVYTDLVFKQVKKYELDCVRQIPKINDRCGVQPTGRGKFSYIESTETYPCNKELYDSSELIINNTTDIPISIKTDFENYFTSGSIGGNYVLDPLQTDFRNKNIRHFRFPNNNISPFMYDKSTGVLGKSAKSQIYPIGVRINNDIVKAFLDIAVKNNILTQEERDRITGYEIYRGDRRTQRSIIAKGLASNMFNYIDINGDKVYYPNFPFNQRGIDEINKVGSTFNQEQFYTFLSPDTLFEKPTLPNEVYFDGYMLGISSTTFTPMKDHAHWTVLGKKAIHTARALAAAEVTMEKTIQTVQMMQNAMQGGGGNFTWGAAVIASMVAATIGMAITGAIEVAKKSVQWMQTFQSMGSANNFAYIALAQADYNTFDHKGHDSTVDGNLFRGTNLISYIKPGDLLVKDNISAKSYKVNNYNREQSVIIKFDNNEGVNYPSEYNQYDKSQQQIKYSKRGTFDGKDRNTFMPYITLKQYLPSQWGSINSIPWLPTNHCNKLDEDNSCDIVFGGDTFISRLYVKKKFPIFRANAVGLPPDTPFSYTRYVNVTSADWVNNFSFIGYMDYKSANTSATVRSFLLPSTGTAYGLFNDEGYYTTLIGSSYHEPSIDTFYITDEYKFLVDYFSIPSFLVESEINCNYRYGKVGTESRLSDDFAPHVANPLDWVQESIVPISTHEKFYYSDVYSKQPMRRTAITFQDDYKQEEWDKRNDLDNAVIYSNRDSADGRGRSPWLNYKPNNLHTFSQDKGQLVSVDSMSSEQVLLRFEEGLSMFNAISKIDKNTTSMGSGNMFRGRALSFETSDLGYGGTQNTTILSQVGRKFWVDAKRGKIYSLKSTGEGLEDISLRMHDWFKKHLPFKILKYIPNADIDNNYNGVGIAMGYDAVFNRVLITKKDYIPTKGYEDKILFNKEDGYYINIDKETIQSVDVNDTTYFKDVSWTVGYKLEGDRSRWVSYYSYKPNYYISYNDYFQTGINNLLSDEHGVWNHFPMISSYQVFYGKLYPFIIEYTKPTKFYKGMLEGVGFWLEARKYTNHYNFSNIFGFGFNKAYIYNGFQNTGLLNLVFQETNNRYQSMQYPKHNSNSVDILQSEIENKWSFNYLYNNVINEKANLPIWLEDENEILKEIDTTLLNYSARRKDRLRGDYYVIRLIQDVDSRFKMLFRLAEEDVSYYL